MQQYEEHIQEEIDDNTLVKAQKFTVGDITAKVGDVKESGYKNRLNAIKKDRQAEIEQDIERI